MVDYSVIGATIASLILIGGLSSLFRNSPTAPGQYLNVSNYLIGIGSSLFAILYFLNLNTAIYGKNDMVLIVAAALMFLSVINTMAYGAEASTSLSLIFLPVSIIIISLSLFGLFVGSMVTPTGTVFYISLCVIISLYILYMATGSDVLDLGNISPSLPPSSGYYGGSSTRDLYALDRKASETDPNSRTTADLVYLTVAYPTLNPSDKIPTPNTNEIYGSHSIKNYQNMLNCGATALYFDIYFQDTDLALAGSTNVTSSTLNTWRIGTLNTLNGIVQNKRTISLASVLDTTQKSIDIGSNTGTGRTYFLFLNPRYTSTQFKKGTFDAENILAKTIQENVRSCGLPPLSENKNAKQLSSTRINQTDNQIIIIIGGPRPPTSATLMNTVQGTIDLQNIYLKSTDASPATPETALSYIPGVSKHPFDSTTVLCSNSHNSESILVSQNRSKNSIANGTTDVPQLVMIFPDGNDPTKQLYEDSNLPHIRFGSSFPVVYPGALFNGYNYNRNLLNGYSYERTPDSYQIKSYVWSNSIDADTNPGAESFLSLISYCGNTSSNIMNPTLKGDATPGKAWESIMDSNLSYKSWCDTQNTSSKVYLSRPLSLYHPRVVVNTLNQQKIQDKIKTTVNITGKTPVPGYVPKPTVVDHWGPTSRIDLYILRDVVSHGSVYAQKLD
jgi:hypothetical protein